MKKQAMPTEKISYSKAVAEIETIIEQIENDILDVDLLAQKVKRVSMLLSLCKTKLRTTENELEKILNSMDEDEIKDQ